MKNQAIQYLALDVHQATTVATVRKETGAICMRATVATEANAIVGLVRGLGGRAHVVFEEGTQAQWLHDLLAPHAEHVVVCNLPGRSETTNKSDRIDSDWLSEQLRLGALGCAPWFSRCCGAQGVGALLHQPGRRLDPGDAASEGHLSRTRQV